MLDSFWESRASLMPAWFKTHPGSCCCFAKYDGLFKSMSELRGWKQPELQHTASESGEEVF